MKKIVSLSVGAVMVAFAMLSMFSQTIYAQESVSITVCHATGNGGYVPVTVSIHSVDDANGLNGHGNHGGDSWLAFTFNGVNYPGQGSGSCQSVPPPEEEDVCPNLEGIQSEVPEGYILDDGECVEEPPEEDVCPNLEAIQSEVPEGYILSDGQCVQDPPEEDVCPNLEGVQASIPQGYIINVDGNCEVPPPPGGGNPGGGSSTRTLIPLTGADFALQPMTLLNMGALLAGVALLRKGLFRK
jgi:hypothetical protein